ncbi:MAG: hypothetical protein IJN17_07530 [Clostridia bacterium]|nr:hypothetical protein [Oscillospiraceae bacterium]MBQ6702787.1 hypothetical protein [Clostridia bacterium]
MNIEIITSIASVLGSFFATFAGIALNSKLTNYRIEQLEKKVDTHNRVIDRVYSLEKHSAVIDEDMKVVNHRIADLESCINDRKHQ